MHDLVVGRYSEAQWHGDGIVTGDVVGNSVPAGIKSTMTLRTGRGIAEEKMVGGGAPSAGCEKR